jgi:hypothetical protein
MDMRFMINAANFLDRYSIVIVYDETSTSVSEGEGKDKLNEILLSVRITS